MKIAVCTGGGPGILLLQKLFAIGIYPKDLIIITDKNKKNVVFLEFLKFYKMKYNIFENDMISMAKFLLKKKIELLLSVNYRYIFKKEVLKISNIKKINLHPGILPDYKGCFSTPWSIINNEGYSGFTYHLITQNIDEGNIIYQKKIKINKDDTAHTLYYKVIYSAINEIENIFKKNLREIKQEAKGKYYTNKLPYDGKIDISWEKEKIERFIRAMIFPPFKATILEKDGKEYEVKNYDKYIKLVEGK